MQSELRLSTEAREDVLTIWEYYEGELEGLGDRFRRTLRSTLDSIAFLPEANEPVEDGVRRAFLKKFPFVVYYTFETNLVLVIAVMHAKRDPDLWRSRLA